MKTTLRNILATVLLVATVSMGGNEPEGITLNYEIGYSGTVTFKIMTTGGVEIRTLLNNQTQSAGNQSVFWDGKNSSGIYVATGSYVYQITAVINGGSYNKTGYVQYIK
ncbi:MAG: FlgD immunoglobulin-like domain containing protein [Bacteriovoracaceae bacterium]|nr:hypothetical protein [Bacteroidota bacterium]